MLTPLFSAALAAAVFIISATPTGAGVLHRHYRHGIHCRNVIMWCFGFLAVAHLLPFILPARELWWDLISAVTLIAIAALLYYLFRQRIPVISTDAPMRVLAVGAHPDDLEIACGGTLAKLADEGHTIHAVVMSDGRQGGDADLRPGEAIAGANYMGIQDIAVYALTDTRLADHNLDMVRIVEAKITDFNPDMILTHSVNDHHQDHQAVHHSVMRAARRHPTILCFESPSVTRAFSPSFYVDINNHMDIKVHAIAQHKDQSGKPYMGSGTIRGIAAFRGGQAKREFVEAFEPVRVLGSAVGRL